MVEIAEAAKPRPLSLSLSRLSFRRWSRSCEISLPQWPADSAFPTRAGPWLAAPLGPKGEPLPARGSSLPSLRLWICTCPWPTAWASTPWQLGSDPSMPCAQIALPRPGPQRQRQRADHSIAGKPRLAALFPGRVQHDRGRNTAEELTPARAYFAFMFLSPTMPKISCDVVRDSWRASTLNSTVASQRSIRFSDFYHLLWHLGT